jgi:hypothetical protein
VPSGPRDPVALSLVAYAIRDKLAGLGGSMRQPTQELFSSFGAAPSREGQDQIEQALEAAGVGVEAVDEEGRTVRLFLTRQAASHRPRREPPPPAAFAAPTATRSEEGSGTPWWQKPGGIGAVAALGLVVGLLIGSSAGGSTKTTTETSAVASTETETVPGPVRYRTRVRVKTVTTAVAAAAPSEPSASTSSRAGCLPEYPTICVPDDGQDYDCADVNATDFPVPGADPMGFDSDGNKVGCQS